MSGHKIKNVMLVICEIRECLPEQFHLNTVTQTLAQELLSMRLMQTELRF